MTINGGDFIVRVRVLNGGIMGRNINHLVTQVLCIV